MEMTLAEVRSVMVFALGGNLSEEREAEIGEAFDKMIRLEKASAFDQGVGIAGRYGHEDGWTGGGPYAKNPWRTPEELVELGYGEDEDW
jgi:hypothetical protein